MYMIIRYYRESARRKKVINTCLTIEQAREHCSDPATRKEGVYFDGYTEQRYAVRSLSSGRKVVDSMTLTEAEARVAELTSRYNKRYTITPMDRL
jgi:hypothetical protein